MYTQEIVCPSCGKKTTVNVLDTQGRTSSPCQHCRRSITISTDKDGKINGIFAGSCFIATACVNAVGGAEQSNYELSLLREYRDEYVRKLDFGESLLREYYSIAPGIVMSILAQKDSRQILCSLHENYIAHAVSFIEAGERENALDIYFKLIEELKSTYSPAT